MNAESSAWVVPDHARPAWDALSRVLAEQREPAPCEAAPEAWFTPLLVEDARAGCARCPAVAECLAYALVADERTGVWGGLDERQRRERVRRAS
ncbi:WhiB family transcriptional regulator [Cellulomonas sp. ATA003]|uniref:WhiB family transcriptional regulator n=1 Tax=Cellulomonas sp. ATA003 TaxID=3073064 RepID=UPI0028733273|nr:WhiB family transcriptional regulator [Cellulomonas sp. ATA003]WNB84529.1 WhiB family transcriptional regulator [Cellulomonas sp. ATA003]